MKEPDFEFWRKEQERVLSAPFNEYREDIEVGNFLNAIDVILETEPLIRFLRGNVMKLEAIIETFLATTNDHKSGQNCSPQTGDRAAQERLPAPHQAEKDVSGES